MASSDDVILNVYELVPDNEEQQQQQSSVGSGFMSHFLKPMGFGAYHTSISIKGYCYTFAAVAGVSKAKDINSASMSMEHGVPRGGVFQESIKLGKSCLTSHGEINEVVNNLKKNYFTDSSYHLLNRNCNHFTEVFATALVLADQLADRNPPVPLKSYPKWVNRLAKSGTTFVNHGDVCDVKEEARKAVGAQKKVGRDLWSWNTHQGPDKAKKGQKKELTPAQQAALAKLKKGGKN